MEIQSKKIDGTPVVAVFGRIDALTASEYEAAIQDALDGEDSRLILDFGGLDYISSAGLRVILATAKSLKSKGGQVLLAGACGTVKEVFDISGFCSIFTLYDSVSAAIAAVD